MIPPYLSLFIISSRWSDFGRYKNDLQTRTAVVTGGKARVSDSNSFRGGRGSTVNGWTEREERATTLLGLWPHPRVLWDINMCSEISHLCL